MAKALIEVPSDCRFAGEADAWGYDLLIIRGNGNLVFKRRPWWRRLSHLLQWWDAPTYRAADPRPLRSGQAAPREAEPAGVEDASDHWFFRLRHTPKG
jgi:hypothetical protein